MMNQRAFVIIAGFLLTKVFCYEIRKPTIERLNPKGLRVSIPDETTIHYFAFHANVNKRISINDNGEIVGEVSSSSNNRWSYEDKNIVLQPEDILHYWIYVQSNESGYTYLGNDTKDETRLTNRSPAVTNSNCETSITSVRGKIATCKDRLVFEEQFDNEITNDSQWAREILLPLDPDYEFAAYRELPKNLEISNSTLQIVPLISDAEYGDNASLLGTLNLGDLCTGSLPTECKRTAIGFSILPPVVSARLTTKQTFHFRYGKIDIRAKFPKGDWLYPELWLEPKYKTYGDGYSSGRVILGMSRGNEQLVKLNNTINSALGSSLLEFGLRTERNNNLRENIITKKKEIGMWNQDFHVYTTIWNDRGFRFQVDGEEVGRIDPPPRGWLNTDQSMENPSSENNKMIPYNNEFYITLGLGVGGVRVFPDRTMNGKYAKPWRNVEAKAMLHFWQGRDKWLPSWKDKNGVVDAKLQVDYVKVWTV